jgi:hypothetical protein
MRHESSQSCSEIKLKSPAVQRSIHSSKWAANGAPRPESVIVIRPAFDPGVFCAYDRRAMQRDWDVSGEPAVKRIR